MGMVCEKCNGHGVVDKDGQAQVIGLAVSQSLVECECQKWPRIAASMPIQVASAPFRDEHLIHPLVDMVRKSCFVLGAEADFLAIVKIAILKNWPKRVMMTTDLAIKNVFCGDKSKSQMSEGYSGVVYNNLEDFLEAPDLVIIHLNKLGSKNKAAAGALEEALMFRFDKRKPTWAFSDIDRPFAMGTYTYSDEVMRFLQSRFKGVNISRIFPIEARSNSPVVNDAGDIEQRPAYVPPKQNFGRDPDAVRPRRQIQSVPDDEASPIDTIGQGVGKSKKFRGRD